MTLRERFTHKPQTYYALSIAATWAGIGSLMNGVTMTQTYGVIPSLIWVIGNILACVLFAGCDLASGAFSGTLTLTVEGLLLGLGSGVFYASSSIFARMAMKHYKSLTITFYTFLVAACGSLALLLLGVGDCGAAQWNGTAAVNIAGLWVLATVAPYLLYTGGLQELGDGGKASILASIEPVVAAFVGVLAFGEPLGLGTVGGLICILISVFILR